MGLRERADSYFGKRVREERSRLGWSQEELAKRLTDNGIPIYNSTVAKIENERKPRAVRLGEAAALADLFGVTLDSMLGRRQGTSEDELAYNVRVLRDNARQHLADVGGIMSAITDAVADAEFAGIPDEVGEIWSTLEEETDGAWQSLSQAEDNLGAAARLADQLLDVVNQTRELQR
jgi:transcriptional regulator with XRE-family HTH domain